MEENKFEKQVQQKMDELQIQPSDAVWKKIEVQIEKKKSRRWGLIILFLLTGFILSGGYWLWNARQQITSEDTNSSKARLEKNINSIKENKTVHRQINSVTESVHQKNNTIVRIKESAIKRHNKFSPDSRANQKINSDEKNSITFYRKKEIRREIHGNTEAEAVSPQSLQIESANKNINKEPADSIHEKINVDSLSKPVTENISAKNNDTSKQKQINTGTVKLSKKNKWKLGILFIGGISGVGNNFLGLTNSLPEAYISASNPATNFRVLSSEIKAGFGFITGTFAEKSISKKAKFISGINFKSFSTSLKLHDSSGTYSARSGSHKYINHFNFIELPVSVQIQIGKGNHIPLFWRGRIAISELISSNALQFNSSTGYYYYNNSLFNKTQIEFNTAFLASLFSKQKNSFLIGPYFYYDASKIANEGLYGKKHFVFAGLHTEIIFGK